MNIFEFTEIPNTKGKYGMNKDRDIIDFKRKSYIVPFGDGKRVKIVYNGQRTSKGVDQLFTLTFGEYKHTQGEHPIISEIKEALNDIELLKTKLRGIVEKFG